MTEQNMIPADKVQELADKYDNAPGNPDRLLVNAIADLRALLPAPPQPTGGLLGRWAKHDAFGDVVVISDHSPYDGNVWISYPDNSEPDGASTDDVPLADLTFPEQATKPEDVPAGEAWLVNLNGGKHTRVVALKASGDTWRIGRSDSIVTLWRDEFVELVCPLTPERPVSDLQAKYDALEDKYREAQEKIEALSKPIAPRIVATEAEYAALPIGSIVSRPDAPHIRHAVFKKIKKDKWQRTGDNVHMADRHMAQMELPVLRSGWGDEQPAPAWRIETDHKNLRIGEYIIDCEDEGGVVSEIIEHIVRFEGSDRNCTSNYYSPFIVFPNVYAATPEAVAEAKRARDKEMDK